MSMSFVASTELKCGRKADRSSAAGAPAPLHGRKPGRCKEEGEGSRMVQKRRLYVGGGAIMSMSVDVDIGRKCGRKAGRSSAVGPRGRSKAGPMERGGRGEQNGPEMVSLRWGGAEMDGGQIWLISG